MGTTKYLHILLNNFLKNPGEENFKPPKILQSSLSFEILEGNSPSHRQKAHTVNSLLSPPSQISPPFQGKKVNKPLVSFKPLLILNNKWWTVLINHDCKTSCGLIQNGLFSNLKFGFVFDPRLHDLQPLALKLFYFVFLVLFGKLILSSLL